jgi:hypothetical protein
MEKWVKNLGNLAQIFYLNPVFKSEELISIMSAHNQCGNFAKIVTDNANASLELAQLTASYKPETELILIQVFKTPDV